MIAMRCIRSGILGALAATLLAGFGLPGSAGAAEPWWHLNAGAAPAILQAGHGRDEIQEITTDPSAAFGLEVNGVLVGRFESQPYPSYGLTPATAQNVQGILESAYGSRNVEVSGGPGGAAPLTVKSTNEDANRSVPKVNVVEFGVGRATAKIVTEGRTDGRLLVTAANLGDADLSGAGTPVTIADKLPAGLTATAIEGRTEDSANQSVVSCTLASLSCTFSGLIPPYEEFIMSVAVNVSGAKSGELNEVAVAGGNVAPAKMTRPITVENQSTPYGIENYELTPEEEGGATDTQAGSHPFQLTSTLNVNRAERITTPALAKDLNFKLPPGLIGNPVPFPRCKMARFAQRGECPNDTAIGVANLTYNADTLGGPAESNVAVPLFNLTPSIGEPARFGFAGGGTSVVLDTAVRTGGDYGVTVSVKNITELVDFLGSRVTFWGVPGDPRHDGARGWSCVDDGKRNAGFNELYPPCTHPGIQSPPPLLEFPTSCTGPLQTVVETDSWKEEGSFTSAGPSVPLPSLDGCNALPFSPSISVAPDGEAGSTATGLTVGVHVPQGVSLDTEGLGEADVRSTTIALPSGVALNPAAADGLLSCSESQAALDSGDVSSCPEASKVGTLEIRTPLLPNALKGTAYLAAQDANPFGSLVALYLVAQDPVSGTIVKLAGEIKPDAVTGQLVSTFKNTPQLPFEDLELHFFGGARAPLGTPALCGLYTTTSSIEAWSGNPPATPSSTFKVNTGPSGAACQNPLPFSPSLRASVSNLQTGAFTPFTMTMSREDGNQNLKAVQLRMPAGLVGTLAGVKLCGEEQANAGACGPESLIGETTVSVGLGDDPFSVTGGKVYLTGPYNGGPFGLSIVNPAKAGPFDLGQVVVRAKIEVDPITSALTITTDNTGPYKIPTIIDGIPLQIKHINVSIDRPGFMLNPTNCNPMQITGTISSAEESSANVSVPFQVTNCATLGFTPKFTASTSGHTSRSSGASLDTKISYPKGALGKQANIASVKVKLPRQLPSRLTTLQKACTDKVFGVNPANCPVASRVGTATTTTPIIPVPLSGPVYFVSHGAAKFPELIIVLSGYGVTVQLHGETFISKTGITSTTFKTVPDVPVGSFELKLPQGRFSALANNGDLCKQKLLMPTRITAQNGLVISQNTKIAVSGCAKRKTKGAGHRRKKKK